MSTVYDKPGAEWNRINTDDYFTNYFKMNEIGDVVQQEKKSTIKSTTTWISFQGNINPQISFVRYHRQRGASYLLAK
jgi:hypothetical protein